MRVTSAYLFGLAVVGLGLCPPPAPAQKGGDKSPLEGVWVVAKVQVAGGDAEQFAGDDEAPTMTFKGDTYAFAAGGMTVEKGTFQTDAKAKPATIDLKIVSGPGKGKTQLGIYELDGDTLKLCLSDEGAKDRPTKFGSAKDAPEFMLATLKRKTAAK